MATAGAARRAVRARVAQLPVRPLSPGSSGSVDSSDYNSEENCPVFIDRDGNMVEVMCCDYGATRPCAAAGGPALQLRRAKGLRARGSGGAMWWRA